MRFIMPIILIGIAITSFFMFTNPMYNDITSLRTQVSSYNEALANSKTLENERDQLTQKESAIDPANLVKLEKLLPSSIENIRLILQIEQIASTYNMVVKNIKYDTTDTNSTVSTGGTGASAAPVVGGIQGGGTLQVASKNYGTWNLGFSTTSTYNNFINFTKDLEKNLRIVDVSSIQFSSGTSVGLSPNSPGSYNYDFNLKTYWLKS
jgi:Tfp pilus assembly protein PilO